MTAALLHRVRTPARWPVPPAGPPVFRREAWVASPASVALDMGDLADRVRSLMNLACGGTGRVPLGGTLFDVVVTANGHSARAMIRLMDEVQIDGCGPVIEDPGRSWLYWLVPPGTSLRWEPHRYAICLGRPYELALPPLGRTEPPGPHWLRPCKADRLVPATPLRDSLDRFQPAPVPHEVLLAAELRSLGGPG
ncbi:hypothetical protein ABZ626_38020 [Streptomyces longispororuber]|uniref:hypothetical protein n=1 Tax=Streptomyces longispororuber TaxID=68230 RepID=UPI0033C3C8CE